MNGCTMAVVQPNSMEDFDGFLCVIFHELPEIRTVLGLLAIPQLTAVSPGEQLSPQVNIPVCESHKSHFAV